MSLNTRSVCYMSTSGSAERLLGLVKTHSKRFGNNIRCAYVDECAKGRLILATLCDVVGETDGARDQVKLSISRQRPLHVSAMCTPVTCSYTPRRVFQKIFYTGGNANAQVARLSKLSIVVSTLLRCNHSVWHTVILFRERSQH